MREKFVFTDPENSKEVVTVNVRGMWFGAGRVATVRYRNANGEKYKFSFDLLPQKEGKTGLDSRQVVINGINRNVRQRLFEAGLVLTSKDSMDRHARKAVKLLHEIQGVIQRSLATPAA